MRKPTSTSSSPRSRADAFTLIEIAAALAILGALLAGILVAKARHTRQLARAEQKRAAVRAAEKLVAGWRSNEGGIPRRASGEVADPRADDRRFSWRTRPAAHDELNRLGAQVVRVAIRPIGTERTGEPLFTLALVVSERARRGEGDGQGASEAPS